MNINVKINKTGVAVPNMITIGHVEETNAITVVFDISAWVEDYGSAYTTLLFKRNGDTIPYPVTLVEKGNIVEWTVNQIDTSVSGNGYIELNYIKDNLLVKSSIINVNVLDSIGESGPVPDVYERWINQLIELSAETTRMANLCNQYLSQIVELKNEIEHDIDVAKGEVFEGIEEKLETIREYESRISVLEEKVETWNGNTTFIFDSGSSSM